MFYERLHSIYRSSGCDDQFPLHLLESLESYISAQSSQYKRLISPYKFALNANINLEASLQFFMYFSQANGVFLMRFFFDCTRYSCGERIYVDRDDINNPDYHFNCSECGKSYKIGDIINYLKVYFEVRPEFDARLLPEQETVRIDPNSTIQVLQGMPQHLKVKSPSYSNSGGINTIYEGDSSTKLETLFEINQMPNGTPINHDLEILRTVADSLRD